MKFWYGTMFLLASTTMVACGKGPIITVCISNPDKSGFECVDHEQKKFFLPYQLSENYVATPSEDLRSLLEYMKRNCQ